MRRTALILAAIITVSLVGFMPAPEAHAGGCPPVQRYMVGGNGDPASAHVPHVPGNYRVRITYPADVFRGDYSRSVAGNKLDRAARAYRANCPGGRIEVHAYSLGSSAASLIVDRWQSQPRMARNTAAYYWGNPRQRRSGGFAGIEASGLPNVGGIYTWRGSYRLGPIPIRSTCHRNDIICHAPRPIHSNLGAAWNGLVGYATTAHRY